MAREARWESYTPKSSWPTDWPGAHERVREYIVPLECGHEHAAPDNPPGPRERLWCSRCRDYRRQDHTKPVTWTSHERELGPVEGVEVWE